MHVSLAGTIMAAFVALWSNAAAAQSPQPPADKVYPDPRTTPGDIIEPPGMAPKPLPKVSGNPPAQKETEQGPVNLEEGAIVIGADDKNVGRVSKVTAGADGWVQEIHIKIEGVEGASGKTFLVRAGNFGRGRDGIRLTVPSSAISTLPEVRGEPG